MQYPKSERIVTPMTKCLWAQLDKPNTKFDKDGSYEIELIFDPKDAVHNQFLQNLKSIHSQAKNLLAANKKTCQLYPWKKHTDIETEQNTGEIAIRFKTSFKPFVADARGNAWPEGSLIGNGSMVRVSFVWTAYEGFGGGAKLYLAGVQVLDLVSYTGGTLEDFGFEVEEGFDVAQHYDQGTNPESTIFNDNPDNTSPSIPEDYIPF